MGPLKCNFGWRMFLQTAGITPNMNIKSKVGLVIFCYLQSHLIKPLIFSVFSVFTVFFISYMCASWSKIEGMEW